MGYSTGKGRSEEGGPQGLNGATTLAGPGVSESREGSLGCALNTQDEGRRLPSVWEQRAPDVLRAVLRTPSGSSLRFEPRQCVPSRSSRGK